MDNMINMRVRAIRKKMNMTQKEVAYGIGMKSNTYAKMEKNGSISYERILKLAKFFRVNPQVILGNEEKNESALILSDAATEKKQFVYPKDEPFTASHAEQELLKILREISIKSGTKDFFNSILLKAKKENDSSK